MHIGENQHCCGCGACQGICPVHAVKMKNDREGFIRAYVAEEKCISCGMCTAVCPVSPDKSLFSETRNVFAAVNKDEDTVRRSSSGGVFSALARELLDGKGAVYGCAMNENIEAVHIRITDAGELDRLRRSKYVQSNTGETFEEVRKDLEEGRKVLYSGTPCQIAGLRLFLKKKCRDFKTWAGNLYCADLICHGVPSPGMFAENIRFWQRRYSPSMDTYEFRLKPDNCRNIYFFFCVAGSGGVVWRPWYRDPYYEAFYNFKSYNEMCYQCPFACRDRVGDITIGDYHWAAEHHEDLREKNQGKSFSISCLLVNTEQGEHLLDRVKDKFDLYPTERKWVEERNKNLIRPTLRPRERDSIYQEIQTYGYGKWAAKYYVSWAYVRNLSLVRMLARMKRKFKDGLKGGHV